MHMTEETDMDYGERWTEEDDAAVIYESLPDWHPALFVDAFRLGLESDEPSALELLRRGFVTPESVDAWGDFSAARQAVRGLRISMKLLWAEGAPDVSYVRFVDRPAAIVADMRQVPAALHATVVWRPELTVTPGLSWRIHGLGAPIAPASLPRTAEGFDPHKLLSRKW